MKRAILANNEQAKVPVNAAEPAGVNGDIYYDSTSTRFRGFGNGVWKNFAFEDTAYLMGKTITVDPDQPLSTDTRTGISKYSQSVPFKTIQAAVNTAAEGDVVWIKAKTGGYTENVLIDPNGYGGWSNVVFKMERAVINGNFTTANANMGFFNIFADGFSVINGAITYAFQGMMGKLVGVTIRDGIYMGSTIQSAYIKDCTITWINPVATSLSATCVFSKLTWNASWPPRGMTGSVKFTYCDVKFNAPVMPGAGGLVGAGGVDWQMTNCKFDITGQMFDILEIGNFRLLLRSTYIRFVGYFFSIQSAVNGIYAAHECKFVNLTTGANMISGGPNLGTWIMEHINTARDCPLGVTALTVASNDAQVASITEF